MSARRRATGLVLALAVSAGACSSVGAVDEPAAPGSTPGTSPVTAVPGADLAGRWAHYDIVAYQDDVMKTMIVSYGFTDFRVEGGQLIESEEFCTAEQVSDQPMKTSISDRATQAIVPESTPVTVSGEPGAWQISRPATPTPVGIELDDPANERLPTDPTDPRIVDDDGDGKPGITVVVELGDAFRAELYLARREIFAYEMVQDGPDSIVGTVTDSSEQLVIGASDPLLESTTAQWAQHPDLTFSPIQLRRVDPSWDCDRLVAELDGLFGPPPPIAW